MSIKQEILIFLLGFFYFLYTLSYAFHFSKTGSIIFSRGQRRFHIIMIWIIPFIWIMILKAIMKPYDTESKTKKKSLSTSNTNADFYFTDMLYSFFHTSSNSHTSHGSHDSHDHGGGYDSHGHDSHFGDSTDAGGGHH